MKIMRNATNHKVYLLFLKERKEEFAYIMNTSKEEIEFERARENYIAYDECYKFYCAIYGVK